MTNLRDKYRKVKTLTERGATEGERTAAQAALERMEEAHPELKQGPAYQVIFDLSEMGSRTYSAGENFNVVITYYWA
jgi:hypothetical protein